MVDDLDTDDGNQSVSTLLDKGILVAVVIVPLMLFFSKYAIYEPVRHSLFPLLLRGIFSCLDHIASVVVVAWIAFSYPLFLSRKFAAFTNVAVVCLGWTLFCVLLFGLQALISGGFPFFDGYIPLMIAATRFGWLFLVVIVGMFVSRVMGIYLLPRDAHMLPKRRSLSILDLLLATSLCAVLMGMYRALVVAVPDLGAHVLRASLFVTSIADTALYMLTMVCLIVFRDRSNWIQLPILTLLHVALLIGDRLLTARVLKVGAGGFEVLFLVSCLVAAIGSVIGMSVGLHLLQRFGLRFLRV